MFSSDLELLRSLSKRLKAIMRESDTLARLGGDEFAILMPKLQGSMAAITVAERVAGALTENFLVAGVPVSVGVSIGIAVYPDHGEDVETVMQHADVAMYRAKQAGLDYALYSSEQDPHDASMLSLAAELRGAIETDQLELHYQPKYLISDSGATVVEGVEALVRWQHPTRGLLPPSDFVPIAERTGLIRPLTSWVLATGLRQLRSWHEAGLCLSMAMNVSPRSLTDMSLIPDIERALNESGVDPRGVILEVTENSFMSDPARSIRALESIRALGIAVSIDDFGTGYSSLAYLRLLPVTEVKIDRSFIRELLSSSTDQSIVQATIALAHSLGFKVVAEGVEDEATLGHLREMGCDVAQGFHLCRPHPANELVDELLPHASPVRELTRLS